MSVEIPFQPSIAHYTMSVTFDDLLVPMRVRWNSRAAAWYVNLYEPDAVTPIIFGMKIVLGVNLGRRSTHPFFQSNLIRAVDTTRQGREATFDDIGTRVKVVRFSLDELLTGGVNGTEI